MTKRNPRIRPFHSPPPTAALLLLLPFPRLVSPIPYAPDGRRQGVVPCVQRVKTMWLVVLGDDFSEGHIFE